MPSRSIRYRSLSIRSPRFVGVGVGDDNDAAAFLQEAGITDYMQQRAIFELVSRLKGAGLWSKMKAVYPFIGGTASTHKWNLKDPRDVDAAFRLSFSGGWTHSSTGADPNGTNAWADTFITPSANLSQDSTHVSYYSREDGNDGDVLIGSEQTVSGNFTHSILIQPDVSGVTYVSVNAQLLSANFIDFSDTDSRAFYVASRNSSSSHESFRNGAKVTKSASSSGLSNQSVGIACYVRNATRTLFTDRECAFATIGDGLTDTDATNLHTIVDLYQKRLSRAV